MRFLGPLFALQLLFSFGAFVSAAERPPETVARAIELPAPRATGKELVLLVGGLGSDVSDGSWDPLTARLFDDPRYEVVRFGARTSNSYDTTGDVDENAERLIREIRTLGPRYKGVHLVAHSMGGAVADRAFANGLSASDRVLTYVALAAPHRGSTVAAVGQRVLELAGGEASEVRAAASGLIYDPDSEAARDLATRKLLGPPADIARLNLRLATDLLVIDRDWHVPGVDSRTLLPTTLRSLEGHGGILNDPSALDLVTTTIANRAPPPDERGEHIQKAAELVSLNVGDFALAALLLGAIAALAGVILLRGVRLAQATNRRLTPGAFLKLP